MRPSELLRELHEANHLIARRLETRNLWLAKELAMTLADIRELEWLAQDYPEFIDEMSLGGTTYKPR